MVNFKLGAIQFYDKLKELYPNAIDNLVLGRSYGIIGKYGLKIQNSTLVDRKVVDHVISYKENDHVPILRFEETGFTFIPFMHPVFISYEKLKGIYTPKKINYATMGKE